MKSILQRTFLCTVMVVFVTAAVQAMENQGHKQGDPTKECNNVLQEMASKQLAVEIALKSIENKSCKKEFESRYTNFLRSLKEVSGALRNEKLTLEMDDGYDSVEVLSTIFLGFMDGLLEEIKESKTH